jgi:tetratricopeptide (TPR) repeat protein
MSVNSKKIIITIVLLGFFAWSTPQLYRHALADFQSWSARQRLAAGDAEAAESLLAKSLQQVNSNPSYYYYYGRSLYTQARDARTSKAALDLLQQSKNAYEKAATLNPLEGDYWFRLAQTSWWLSRFKGHEHEGDKVEAFFQQALAVAPNNPVFVPAIVQYYSETGQVDRSLEYVRRLALISPQAYSSLKKRSMLSGAVEVAFIKGLEEASGNPLTRREALRTLAEIAMKRKDWDTAEHYYLAALKLNPNDKKLHHKLEELRKISKQFKKFN